MKIEELIKSNIVMDEAKKAVVNIIYTSNIINDRFYEILKPFDLSNEQYNVLRILRGQKGNPANMSTIQERMITKSSNTTRLIDKLLLKKLVTRNICSSNRRKIEIKITQKGLDLLVDLDPQVIEYENSFAKKITKEELIILNKIIEKYRTDN